MGESIPNCFCYIVANSKWSCGSIFVLSILLLLDSLKNLTYLTQIRLTIRQLSLYDASMALDMVIVIGRTLRLAQRFPAAMRIVQSLILCKA